MLFLPEFPDLEVINSQVADVVQLTLRSCANSANCPLCAAPAQRIQSHYTRTLADLPVQAKPVSVQLLVRRFYCNNSRCPRRIFAERFPILTSPYSRRTNQLAQSLLHLGLALGGEAGAKLGQKLGLRASPDTVLRLVKTPPTLIQPTSSPTAPTKIAIDDWSWKRGRQFGTIIVDLDSHRVVDLLQERSVQTVTAWLQQQPQLQLVSRDRSTEYALAISQGAPQARQVADRFHIVRNLTEQVELLLGRLRHVWRPVLDVEADLAATPIATPPKELPHPTNWKPLPSNQTERKRLARRQAKLDQYNQVVQLRANGLKQSEIVARMGLSEKTIRKWLRAESFPEAQPRPKRRSVFDPYAVRVLERWQAGQQDGHEIWLELKTQGYKGSERTVQRFLQQLRDKGDQPIALPPASPLEVLSAKKAVWWFIRPVEKLSEEEQAELQLLRQAHPSLEEVYGTVQRLMAMVRERTGATELDRWLAEIKESEFEELQSFGRGIERDKAAVVAGLSLEYNNGIAEGHNHRLKLIKRSMYGRAKLALLKQRVLAA